jgi:hypothetical protein
MGVPNVTAKSLLSKREVHKPWSSFRKQFSANYAEFKHDESGRKAF